LHAFELVRAEKLAARDKYDAVMWRASQDNKEHLGENIQVAKLDAEDRQKNAEQDQAGPQ
jgi:hypothetical protein